MSDNKNENMIFIYDVFTDLYKNENLRLAPNELYLYCFLYKRRNYDQVVEITIDSIHQIAPVKFYPSVDSKNRKIIKDTLLSLKDKGVISFDYDNKLYESRKGNAITIHIVFNQFTDNSGHLRIPYSDYDAAYDINYFYIRVAVERFNNVKTLGRHSGRWISEKEFGYLLGVSKRTFRNYADDMINKGLLYKVSGERHNSMEQDKNVYRTIPFEDVETEDKIKVKDKVYSKDMVFDTAIGTGITVADIKDQWVGCNWGKRDMFGMYEKITQDDYDTYRVSEDLGICMRKVLRCKSIIESKRDSFDYDGIFERYEENYMSVKLAVT